MIAPEEDMGLNNQNSQPDHRNQKIEELLAAHADALLTGAAGQEMAGQDAAELFQLAERLHHHYAPVEPSSDFLSRLKSELVSEAPIGAAPGVNLLARWRRLPTGYRLVASLGGLTLTAALTLLAAHRALQNRQNQPKPESGLSLNTAS